MEILLFIWAILTGVTFSLTVWAIKAPYLSREDVVTSAVLFVAALVGTIIIATYLSTAVTEPILDNLTNCTTIT